MEVPISVWVVFCVLAIIRLVALLGVRWRLVVETAG